MARMTTTKRLGLGLGLGLIVGLAGWLLAVTPWGARVEEDAGLSWLFQLRGARPAPADVIVVALDRQSAERLGLPPEPQHWPRSEHARLVANLARAGATTIAFDLFFGRSTEHDGELASALREAGNVVLVGFLRRDILPGKGVIDALVTPTPAIGESAFAVAAFPLPKVPNRVDTFWTFLESAGQDSPSFPVVAFQTHSLSVYDDLLSLLRKAGADHALPASAGEILQTNRISELSLALRTLLANDSQAAARVREEIAQGDQLDVDAKRVLMSLVDLYEGSAERYLNYYGPPRSINTIAYDQALRLSEAGDSRSWSQFKGKAVFVGFSEALQPQQRDNYYTVYSQPSGLDLSGVEIAATAFANLLEGVPVKPLERPVNFALLVLWGLLLGVVCQSLPVAVAAIATLGLMFGYLATAVHQFTVSGIWLPLTVPLCFQAPLAFGWSALSKYRSVNRERQNIRRAFGYYLPRKVVDELAQKAEGAASENQLVYGTCLATDVERYTTVAENMDPRLLSALMNDYYRSIFRPVEHHGGMISDVEGDAMLAIWAASSPDAGLRSAACQAALDIVHEVNEFNQKSGRPALRTRIGLDFGVMVLGSIGAAHHYEYRAVGDIVNTAHRIQSLNKRLGTGLLASEATLEGVADFLVRPLGSFMLQGKSRTVNIVELLCRNADATEQQLRLCDAFAAAMEAYLARQWQPARDQFSDILRRFPNDGPARFYLKLCEEYRTRVPSSDLGVVHIYGD